MKFSLGCHWLKNRSYVLFGLLSLLIFLNYPVILTVNAFGVFSNDEIPFGVSYDTWIPKWWDWWVGTNPAESTPQEGGCLTNVVDKMVMLMETADTVGDAPTQKCNISTSQGVMILMWGAWCSLGGDEEKIKDLTGTLSDRLAQCAKEAYDLGHIKSNVKVDGITVASLDVTNAIISGKLDSKITRMDNVSEIFTKGFNITIPPDTHKPNYQPGIHPAGAHGYWVFLKPLPAGDHAIQFDTFVSPPGAVSSAGTDNHRFQITYNLRVQ